MKEKRELILQAVLDLFVEKGITGLKVSTIASRADIGKGTVYEYFSSKEDLFIGAIEYGMEQLTKMLEEKMAKTITFRESFDGMVECITEVTERSPFMSFISGSSTMPFSPNAILRIKAIMEKGRISFTDIFLTILNKGQNECIIKIPENPEYVQAMLLIITNMTMHNIHFQKSNQENLKEFYYEACLKLFS